MLLLTSTRRSPFSPGFFSGTPGKAAIRALVITLLSLIPTGCLQSPRNHYVKTAEANVSSIPLVPATLQAGKDRDVNLALRIGNRVPTRTNFVTRPVYETTPDPGSGGFRGDYAIRQGPFRLGVDMRQKALDIFDVYATSDATFGAGMRGAGLLGFGVTIAFPLLNIRLSPAVGIHGYTNTVMDSVITHVTTFSGETYADTSTHVIGNRTLRMGPVGSFSVSAWPPNPSGHAWTPYVQYQANWIGMGAKDKNSTVTAPSDIMILHARIVAVGVEYVPAKSFVWNTRVAGEYLWNRQDGAWGYRVETGIGLHLGR